MKIITGMHRSGTSMTSNFLMEILGQADSQKEYVESDQWNPKGYFENTEIVVLNNTILLGKYAPSSQIMSDPNLQNKKLKKIFLSIANFRYAFVMLSPKLIKLAARQQKTRIADLSQKFHNAIIKDPRFSLLLDAWLEWGSIEKILVCFRDPKEVAESLRKRNRLPLWIGFWLWKFHNTQLLETIEKHKPNQVVFIQYNNFFHPQKREKEMQRLYVFLGVAYDAEQARHLLDQVLDPRLKHFSNDARNYPKDIQNTLDKLISYHQRTI